MPDNAEPSSILTIPRTTAGESAAAKVTEATADALAALTPMAVPAKRRHPVVKAAQVYTDRMRAKEVCPERKPSSKIWWSGLGALLGILAIQGITLVMPTVDALFLIGSFGASAVLIYGAPMAEFSQPRNLVGGHIASALVGVAVASAMHLIPSSLLVTLLGPAVAVSGAIVLMHYTRTLHPPGGATALIAVIGGPKIHALGWLYVLFPVTCGALIMLLVALGVNNASHNPKRHYPRYWL